MNDQYINVNETQEDIITDFEMECLKECKIAETGVDYSEEEEKELRDWINETFLAASLVELAISGHLCLSWDSDKQSVIVSGTDLGKSTYLNQTADDVDELDGEALEDRFGGPTVQ